jgi:hypothetical protein
MEKDLLPWILGAALIAAGAVGATIEFAERAPPAAVRAPAAPPVAPAVTPVLTAAAPPDAAPASLPATVLPDGDPGATGAPATGPASADASANGGSQLPSGEVWQCMVNGQKIFSDKRCGNGASVRQIGDINVMDVPAPAPYGMYRPGYAGAPYPAGPSYPDDQDDSGVDSDGYVGQQLIVARERARREHHRQDNHPHPAASHAASGAHNPR